MKIPTTSDGLKYTELEKVMDFSKTWIPEKRIMVDGFEKHPWGRVAFTCLVNSVKIVDLDKESYTVQGCVHALLIWLYENVSGIGELSGLRRSTSTGIPLLDWQSPRKGIKIDEFIKNEMATHGQVRVRHMVHVSEENMYPKWSDDVEKDPALELDY